MGAPGSLNRKQEAAIAALLNAKSHRAAAKKAGVAASTLQRWLLQPEFLEAYRDARRTVVETALAQLQRATGAAVATLERNLKSKEPSGQIRAALAILQHSIKAIEVLDLDTRVRNLEAIAKQKKGNGP